MRWSGDTIAPNRRGAMWGRQIRSYVMHPEARVKDLRTGVETADLGAVLDGDLDQFLRPALEGGHWPKARPHGAPLPEKT